MIRAHDYFKTGETVKKIFVGFDSAWRANNSGAVCELVLLENGSLSLNSPPTIVNWQQAVERTGAYNDAALCVWAIDQPICVTNETGCRPVERLLASALMLEFVCGAYSSNLGNPCWAPTAPVWMFLRSLSNYGYRHEPMAIPNATEGKFYLECYPHPALLGLFSLQRTLQYKIHHGDAAAWQSVISLILSLENAELPISGVGTFVNTALRQTKQNEDKLDAIICAYVAAFWWKFGVTKSTMVGDLQNGYMITPHTAVMRRLFDTFFGPQYINPIGTACDPQAVVAAGAQPLGVTDPFVNAVGAVNQEPAGVWQGPVAMCATDTANLWRTSQGQEINAWMEQVRLFNFRLWVRFVEEDAQPAVLFEPFANPNGGQGMKTVAGFGRELWHFLVAEARRAHPLFFNVRYCYEPI